jgi:uncharacterized coiled-coil protein SlyX
MILHKEQVDQMTTEQCQAHINLLDKKFPMTKALSKLTPEQFAQIDDMANTLLYLEDRMRYIQQSETAIAANKARWAE